MTDTRLLGVRITSDSARGRGATSTLAASAAPAEGTGVGEETTLGGVGETTLGGVGETTGAGAMAGLGDELVTAAIAAEFAGALTLACFLGIA